MRLRSRNAPYFGKGICVGRNRGGRVGRSNTPTRPNRLPEVRSSGARGCGSNTLPCGVSKVPLANSSQVLGLTVVVDEGREPTALAAPAQRLGHAASDLTVCTERNTSHTFALEAAQAVAGGSWSHRHHRVAGEQSANYRALAVAPRERVAVRLHQPFQVSA